MKAIISLAILLMTTLTAWADSAKDRWTIYPSYSNITEIEPVGNICFVLASGAVFSYNITDGDVQTYDKAGVMSDVEVSHIGWSKVAKRLVVVYTNSNIDLLSANGDVINVPDLYRKSMTDNKTINHIDFDGPYAYLATAFGVVKLNTRDGAIMDTYQLDTDVSYTYVKNGYLYAESKERGRLRCKLTDNLLDKSRWVREDGFTTLRENRTNVQDKQTNLWWTKTADGKLTYYTVDADGKRTYKTEGVLPEGPASNNFYRLYNHNGKIYAVGGLFSQETNGNLPGDVHVWDGTTWSHFEQPTEAQLGHKNVDYLCMDFDPLKEGHVMVGAKSGLYEFQDGKFVKCYNRDNSPLESATADKSKNYVMATGVKYDPTGNLWVLNSQITNPLKMLSKDGEWSVMNNIGLTKNNVWDVKELFLSPTYGYMWFVNSYWEETKLFAYDYKNNKLYDAGGPTFTNEDNTTLKPYYLFHVTEDKNKNIWLSTSAGPLYMTPNDVKNGGGWVTQHKVPRNDGTNLADYLLSNVETRCIAVDGGNRKWIATSNGVFLISDDCNTQIEHFTTDNSPLLSNTVHYVLVDPNSSTVYFATDKGLCSYQSDATTPNEKMTKDNVYAYPNPVTPDYTGDITIVGLSYNADVKIVTTNGTLVNQGRSTGGSYRWNGCDLKGKRVASGIYMVETATEDGSKGTVCKIAIIN